MEKAGLKTFVYSFVFSLFTLLSVHGVFLRTPAKRSVDTKIPSKNITLFFKNNTLAANSVQSAPAKKIVLSVLPEIKIQDKTTEQIPLTADDFIDDEPAEQIIAANIPLQNSTPSENNAILETKQPINKIADNFEQIMNSPPPTALSPQSETETFDFNSNIETQEEPQSNNPVLAAEGIIQVATNDFSQTRQSQPEPTAKTAQPEQIVAASASIPAQEESVQRRENPNRLIPLEKNSTSAKLVQNEVKTADDVEHNQVALNAHNVPIKSMLNGKQTSPEANTSSDKWQSMSEKQSASKNDTNPWLVAKGGKFPRNKMILQDKSYQQDEEEIRRILSANDTQQVQSNAGTIKLAAETAKNLLIPIPDEIMKEKNITPQLVSSSKNQVVEDELAAKEALHKEESPDDEPESTPLPSQEEKKGGLLDSLSSIFSAKKNTPQIGNSVEEGAESKNSLLSAFTRKRTRATSKILPTEIRLSFQPNRAEISGQTLKWIRAFAQKTAEEASTGLEIRIDGTSSPLLQRRRLNLLQNILMNEGADYSKINTVFTAREPNSFILRTIRINNDNINIPQNRNPRTNNNYMQW